jgi:hypothetical protein
MVPPAVPARLLSSPGAVERRDLETGRAGLSVTTGFDRSLAAEFAGL